MKYCGMIGFSNEVETTPGVWTNNTIERKYYGDVISNRRKWVSADKVNDDFSINISISVVADNYIIEHMHLAKYVWYHGCKWKITSIEPQYPRLSLTLGGEYNGE